MDEDISFLATVDETRLNNSLSSVRETDKDAPVLTTVDATRLIDDPSSPTRESDDDGLDWEVLMADADFQLNNPSSPTRESDDDGLDWEVLMTDADFRLSNPTNQTESSVELMNHVATSVTTRNSPSSSSRNTSDDDSDSSVASPPRIPLLASRNHPSSCLAPSTSSRHKVMCLACQVYQAECTIFNEQLLPQSPAQFCLKCADLWPLKTGWKVDAIFDESKSIWRFEEHHFAELNETVNDWVDANKKKIKSADDVRWDVIHQMAHGEQKMIAKFDADRLRREWHHHLHTGETTRETNKNCDTKENKALKTIVSQFDDLAAIDWDQVALNICKKVHRNKKRVRTGFDCFARYQRRFSREHRQNKEGRGGNYFWSKAEKEKLLSIVEEHLNESRRRTPDWDFVRVQFPGTTVTQLKTQYRRLTLTPKPRVICRPLLTPAPPKIETRGRKKKVVRGTSVEQLKLILRQQITIRKRQARKLSFPGYGRKHGLIQASLFRLFDGQVEPNKISVDEADEETKVLVSIIKDLPCNESPASLPAMPKPSECLPPTLHTLTGLRGLHIYHDFLKGQLAANEVPINASHNLGNQVADQLLLSRMTKAFLWPHKLVK